MSNRVLDTVDGTIVFASVIDTTVWQWQVALRPSAYRPIVKRVMDATFEHDVAVDARYSVIDEIGRDEDGQYCSWPTW